MYDEVLVGLDELLECFSYQQEKVAPYLDAA
jgi:hypothetical protein